MGTHAVGRRGRKAPIQTFLETVEKPTPQRPSPALHERGKPAGHSNHGRPQRPVPENSRRWVGDANGPHLSMASLAESLQANTCDAHLGLPRSWALVKGPRCGPRTAPVSLGRAGSGGAQPVSIHQEMLGAAQGTQGRQERALPSQPLCCPLAGPVGARTAAVSLGGVRRAGTAGLTCPPGCQA